MEAPFIPLEESNYQMPLFSSAQEQITQSADFYQTMKGRRSLRHFSRNPVPRQVIENALRVANTAPSGANMAPWAFVVAESAAAKKELRQATEAKERHFYQKLAPTEWLAALRPLGTNAVKPYLEDAPYTILVFAKLKEGSKQTYYPIESTGIAVGMLITALHLAGLATLTHTPRPMKFLNTLAKLGREYRPYLMLVVGYPHPDAQVPNIQRKKFEDMVTFV